MKSCDSPMFKEGCVPPHRSTACGWEGYCTFFWGGLSVVMYILYIFMFCTLSIYSKILLFLSYTYFVYECINPIQGAKNLRGHIDAIPLTIRKEKKKRKKKRQF